MVCPMSCSVAVIGCSTGHVVVVGLTQPHSPRLLAHTRLFRSPVTILRFTNFQLRLTLFSPLPATACHRSDQRGLFLTAAASSENSVFVCSGLVSRGIEILGHTGTHTIPIACTARITVLCLSVTTILAASVLLATYGYKMQQFSWKKNYCIQNKNTT